MSQSERVVRDKVVIVTGGASGIGYQIADKLLVEGSRAVVIVDVHRDTARRSDQLRHTHGQHRVTHYAVSVCGHSNVQLVFREVVAEYGRVDVLVNSAGVVNEVDWTTCLDVNLAAVMRWGLYAHRLMRHQPGKGTIINISSIHGYRINPYVPVYQATKFGVMGFTKSLGDKVNYEQYGVRVVAICPGFTTTEMGTDPNPKLWPDEPRRYGYMKLMEDAVYQEASVVADAAAEVFKTAESGTCWVIEEGRPIYEV